MPHATPYLRHLTSRANAITSSRSGERTRLRLLAAGAELLQRTAYRDLKVSAVSRTAGQAKGTFYVYFDAKDQFLVELLRGYVAFEASTFVPVPPTDSAFRSYLNRVEWYERTFARNAGVIRCMLQMAEDHPDVRRLWHERNARIIDRAVADTVSRLSRPPADASTLRRAIRAVGTMLDQSLFERFRVQVGPGIEAADADYLIEFHAVLGYRALFGANPPARELRHARDLLKLPPLRR